MIRELTVIMITANYNLRLDQIRDRIITKEEGIKAYKDYAEAIRSVYKVNKEFERLYKIDLKRLEEL